MSISVNTNQHRRTNKIETSSHRNPTTAIPPHNGTHRREDLPGQALQIVKSQQVLHAAKENVSESPTIEMSTKLTQSSAAANSTSSQLLMLPPELRSRIYDYVFGSNMVHIAAHPHVEHDAKSIGYRVSNCTCERHGRQLSPRVRLYERDIEPEEVIAESCQACPASQTSASQAFSLPLLQVCRQIYHEAALKPFQQASFNYDFDEDCSKGQGLLAFLRALVPVQVKAITRLRLSCPRPAFLKTTTLAKMRGLKHMGIQLDFKVVSSDHVLGLLGNFASDPIVLALAELDFKSIHLDLGLHLPGRRFKEAAAIHGIIVKPPTADDAKVFEEILKRTEAALLESLG